MTNSANLPAPYGGVNELVPVAGLTSPFCQQLLNFNVNQAGISLRNGDSKFKLLTVSTIATQAGAEAFFAYGNLKLFMTLFNESTNKVDIYDVDAGSVAYTNTTATIGDFFYGLYFNNYLFLFSSAALAQGAAYSGAAWGAIGYTGTNLLPVGGNVYKSRAYLVQKSSSSYWYTNLYQVTGAITQVDLGSILSNNSYLAAIARLTLSDNVATEELQAFIFFSGEILFYKGSYPDSADWSIAGRAIIATPLSYNCTIPYQGDTLVLCDSGVVSLRDLFLKGSEDASSLTINSRIQQTWASLVAAMRSAVSGYYALNYINGVWDPKTDRIIISFPNYLNGTTLLGPSFYFVFYNQLQSWFFHRSFGSSGILQIIRYQNKTLLLSLGVTGTKVMIYEKEGGTGFADRNAADTLDIGYDYQMLSAPIAFPKTADYETTQIEPIIESDLYAQTNWNFVVDFGRKTSGNQTTDAVTTNVAKPAVNVGMHDITFVQVKMSGTTVTGKTVGLDLYSYNVWYNAGEIASR